MNIKTLKATLLATAITLGMGVAPAFADDTQPERGLQETIEDGTITAGVKTRLLEDSRTEGFDINVDTIKGVVTLTGGADSEADKAAATELASQVSGVVSVDNRIIVAAEETALRTAANEATASGEVRAAVEDATDGVDEEARTGVDPADAADPTNDVADLDNDGVDEVGPGPDADSDNFDDAWITSKVKTQLLADEDVKGLKIDVDTKENVVTLSGSVETAAQREAAIRITTATSGVKQVIDNLVVSGY